MVISSMMATAEQKKEHWQLELVTRLVRSLPRSPAEPQALSADRTDPVVAMVLECLTALRDRYAELLKPASEPSPAGETVPLPAFEFHQRPTIAVSAAVPESQALRAETVERIHWGPQEQLLYDDVATLLELGDQTGAMISVERMLMVSPDAEETNEFLRRNESLFRRMYEEYFGSLDRVPVPVPDSQPIKIPARDPALVIEILRLVDGRRTLKEILAKSKFGALRTLMSIAHLVRSGFLELA